MEQRDYLIREIEKIGTVMLALIGRLKRVDNFQQFDQEKEMLDLDIIEIFGISLQELIRLPDDQFLALMAVKEGFNDTNLELFADMLEEVSCALQGKDSLDAMRKCAGILEMIDSRSRTFSFDRQSKLEQIRKKL